MIRRLLNRIPLFKTLCALKKLGILGMNARNIEFISQYNSRRYFPLVDNKLLTKKLALQHQVNVPELLGVIERQHDVNLCEQYFPENAGFCVKPAKGSGGKGILVVRRQNGQYCRSDGSPLQLNDIQRHISNVLAGLFSLGGNNDVALIEGLIEVDPYFSQFSYQGVPDIRVIVFLGIPVMSMIRLSCQGSKGKANLHQGAVGVGLNMSDGSAINAVQHGDIISHHPDNQIALSTLQVPEWDAMLRLACACYDMTQLGYIGVDLVCDKHRGPLLLELNARPGLSIQIANQCGLLPRLKKVESHRNLKKLSIEERIDFAKSL